MIHHFARALAVREKLREAAQGTARERSGLAAMATPAAPHPTRMPAPGQTVMAHVHGIRIHRDPSDNRRTVIAGRFADVCAALDRMVELEAAA